MDTVIIINLNGNAFHIAEPACLALRSYLEQARVQLQDNPDRDEILSDLEQAIADKCTRYLGAHKNVVSTNEMAQILRQMGPVQGDAAGPAQPDATAHPSSGTAGAPGNAGASGNAGAPRRLYRIRDGAMVSGLCKGIAAYFNIDVSIIRLIFVALAILTGGLWALLYIVMLFVIPSADTEEERAAAAGQPFNAQELIDRAKLHYAKFRSKQWRGQWREQRRAWRRQWREETWWWRAHMQGHAHAWAARTGYVGRVLAGVTIPLLALIGAALFIVWLVAVVSLTTTGAIFGWVIAGPMPLWLAVLLLFMVYGMISGPIRHARRAAYFATGGFSHPWFAAWDGILWIGILAFAGWFLYGHYPAAHDFLQHLPERLAAMWNNVFDSMLHKPAPPQNGPTA
ncbi:MAG: PspC domain-containing protein [Steroidobacteraceae bacterium]